jgi:hypothetical protein
VPGFGAKRLIEQETTEETEIVLLCSLQFESFPFTISFRPLGSCPHPPC